MSNLAVFIDIENFGPEESFDAKVLIDKLKERGRLIIKKAYADWGRFSKLRHQMLENSVELIELPSHGGRGKNSADIKLVVDALETAITRDYIDTFVVVSGDSDYTPLISKLREYNKYVIVIGHKKTLSGLLSGYCDELIFYTSLTGTRRVPESDIQAAYDLLLRVLNYLENEGIESRSSQVKSFMRQFDASFNEANYGLSQFKTFLHQAVQQGLVRLQKLEHGDYLVQSASGKAPAPRLEPAQPAEGVRPPDNPVLPLIYWSFLANSGDRENPVSLSDVSLAARELDPQFDFVNYGFARSRGFKGIIKDLEEDGLVELAYDQEKNVHFVRLTEKLEVLGKDLAEPPRYAETRLHRVVAKLGLSFEMGRIDRFAQVFQALLARAQQEGRSLKVAELLADASKELETYGENSRGCSKLLVVAMQSGAIRDASGEPLVNADEDRPVAAVESAEVILAQHIAHSRRVIEEHFHETVDVALLENLFRRQG